MTGLKTLTITNKTKNDNLIKPVYLWDISSCELSTADGTAKYQTVLGTTLKLE